MDEYSRPATLEDLKALIRSLNDQGADYLLIGGYALFVHGYHRATTDIDVLVPATQESGRKVRDALMALPVQAAKDLDPAWFDEGENIRVADAFVVDIMLNAAGETYDTLKQYAETVDFDGLPIRTVNLQGVLRTKQSMRDKDVADRIIPARHSSFPPKAFPGRYSTSTGSSAIRRALVGGKLLLQGKPSAVTCTKQLQAIHAGSLRPPSVACGRHRKAHGDLAPIPATCALKHRAARRTSFGTGPCAHG
jgi:hypothetical protein